MGIPLAPPAAHRIDGIVYTFASPLENNRPLWVLAALCVAGLFSGGSLVGLMLVGLALLWIFWSMDCTVRVMVGLHRLEIVTTRLGLVTRSRALSWHAMSEAVLEGQQIVVHCNDWRRVRIPAWGPLVQLAWVVGAINAQIRRHAAPMLTADVAFDLARLDDLVGASRGARERV